jgi:hypothetical protein
MTRYENLSASELGTLLLDSLSLALIVISVVYGQFASSPLTIDNVASAITYICQY